MIGSPKLVNEIVENASVIPVEYQEHILDVIKAMAFTRKIVQREQSYDEKGVEYGIKEHV